ncbi:MAG: DUF4292 domain-containing protein [Muribaculaceae bacterium]|nr:DUF4292 domain-containing protein [Muribaculaceae bacterium]
MKASKLRSGIFLVLVLVFAAAGVSSCSSHRNNSKSAPSRVVAKRSPQVGQLADTYRSWTDVYMPFSLRCSAPMSINLSGRATMVAGECIYISLRMLGLEVGQVWIDTDSVFVSEKLGKTLVAEPLERLTVRTGLGIRDLQALMLGQAFYPGSGALTDARKAASEFSVTTKDDNLIMTPRRTPEGAVWYFTVAPDLTLSELTVEPSGMKPFIALFSDFIDSEAGRMASSVSIEGAAASRNIDATLVWSPEKARWNQSDTPSKPSWRGYRRMTARDMLDALKNKSF